MSTTDAEPFFLRFQRELVHHEKSALSNPAQLLKLLTGQDRLHHPIILVNEKHRRKGAEESLVVVNSGHRATKICQQLKAKRAQKAAFKSEAALSDPEGLFTTILPQLERQDSPESTEKLLLDAVLGTARITDDLRGLNTFKQALPTCEGQFEALRRTIHHLAVALEGMQPIEVELSEAQALDLARRLKKLELAPVLFETDLEKALSGWCNQTESEYSRLRGRKLRAFACRPCQLHIVAPRLRSAQIQEHRCGNPWFVELSPRTSRSFEATQLSSLACHLLLLVDIAVGEEYSAFCEGDARSTCSQARDLALRILRMCLRETHPADADDSETALQLRYLGTHLRHSACRADGRVPWLADPWQCQLLDAVDARRGSLVVAPTSAGKTFAAYYVMERTLRASNTDAVLFVAPTAALAMQIEAEVLARFGQKPYPHSGVSLCGSLFTGRKTKSKTIGSAQIIITMPSFLPELCDDEQLWARLQWVVCDEMQLQPLKCLKTLARRCGEARVPLLVMSASVEDPCMWQGRFAEATQCSNFELVQHKERVVDLHTFWFDVGVGSLRRLHPLLLRGESPKPESVPHTTPVEALQLWEVLHLVSPGLAAKLAPRLLRFLRVCPIAQRLEHKFHLVDRVYTFIGSDIPAIASRDDFRRWERLLVRVVCRLESSQWRALVSKLNVLSTGNSVNVNVREISDMGPPKFFQLLKQLLDRDLLPCICFHRSSVHLEVLIIGFAELVVQKETALHLAGHEKFAIRRAERRAAWEKQLVQLKERLAEARDHASQRKRAAADESIPSVLADEWGYDANSSSHGSWLHDSGLNKRSIDVDSSVRVAKAVLESFEEQGPPDCQDGVIADFDFTSVRARHVYRVEIAMLVAHVEAGIHEIGRRSKTKQWSQALVTALHRGVAIHFTDPGCADINFAVQLLFRLGYVRVLLADEELGCGMNLPCRAAVILDSSIRGVILTQMAGRAGRRNLDLFGATVFVHDLETLRTMNR